MKLFLFTNFFPYKRSEPFLVTEFPYAEKVFDHISVFALYGKMEDAVVSSSPRLRLLKPVFEAPGQKKSIFKKGFFNLTFPSFHLKELFSKGILFQPSKLYWWLTSMLVTRAALASPAYKELLNDLKRGENAVLYFYWGDNLAWIIPYLKKELKNSKVKIVLRLHGSDLYEQLKADYAPVRNDVFKAADLICSVSEAGSKYLKSKYPFVKDKNFVSRLGVKDHGLNPGKKQEVFRIVSVSNVVAVKRVKLIFEMLQKSDLDLEWIHFGDGPLLDDLKTLAGQSGKNLSIQLMGFMPNEQVMKYFSEEHVDLFLNVSYSEGLPVSIMEALSFGIPVMATDVGGTAELVSENVGRLIKRDFSIAEALSALNTLVKLSIADTEVMRSAARRMFEEKVNAGKNFPEFYSMISK